MRFKLLKKIAVLSFILLILSLAYNQIVRGTAYFQLSQNNRIKLIRLPAARGLIYDRKQMALAATRASFNVSILTQEAGDVEEVIEQISPVLAIPEEKLLAQFKRNFSAPFIPTVVASDVSKEAAIRLECKEFDIPGLLVQTEPLRDYPYGESFCHILGYLGNISEQELRRFKFYGLGFPGLLGRGGLEERYDSYLRGEAGGIQTEVNNLGQKVRVLGQRHPRRGQDLYLTLDGQLQRVVDSLLEQEQGACIVLNPQDGAILALVSKPSFNPNLFIAAVNGKAQAARRVKSLLGSQRAPLINRAISGTYAPGSIFKIAVAAAGLETDKITVKDSWHCPGGIKVGNRPFLCWNVDGHGAEDIYTGLAHSCNVYFYKLGLALGPDQLSLFARKFGLGLCTGIELPYESCGLVPSKRWKLTTYKERWYDGETANFSIGQGYLLANPLQIARMVAAIANGGYLVRPYLVKRVGHQATSALRKRLKLRAETLQIIKQGMRQAIQNEDGTGHRAYIAGVEWAGKTGTAQTAGGEPHGWFAGFYPLKQPQVLVLVFLEHGGSGGDAPARIAREILKYIIAQDIGSRL